MPVAGRALDGLRAGLGTRAVAGRALIECRNADLGFGAARRFLESDLEVVAQVGPAIHVGAPAASAENIPENIAECIREAAHARRACRCLIDARVAVLVVGGALVGVRQNFVSLLGFLELFLGLRIVGVAVGVKFHRELAIRLLDVVFRRIAIDAEHFVIVFFRHDSVQD